MKTTTSSSALRNPRPECQTNSNGSSIHLGLLSFEDLYFGHSAHLFHGVEVYRGKPILYDTGDFIDDYAVDPWLRNDWSFLVTLEAGRLVRLEFVPVVLTLAQVHLAQEPERGQLCHRMQVLSDAFGTHFRDSGERLVWEPGKGSGAFPVG